MSKTKSNSRKTFESPVGEQQKLLDAENAAQINRQDINQGHNTKKEALGPNTRR